MSFETLHERAKSLAEEIEGMDRADAAIVILKTLMAVQHDAEEQAIDAVEVKLLHQEHH
jgi:hypothetical protein